MLRKNRSVEQSWYEQAQAVRAEAEKLPQGKEREMLETKARRLETASQIKEWITSPGLAAPT
jgi:hypothetical protein